MEASFFLATTAFRHLLTLLLVFFSCTALTFTKNVCFFVVVKKELRAATRHKEIDREFVYGQRVSCSCVEQ